MRRGIIIITAILLAASLMVSGCGGKSSEGSKEPIKIGVVSSLSGGGADYGEYQSKSTNLAADEINAAGGVLGRQLQIIELDDATDQSTAVTAVKKLLFESKVDVVIGSPTSVNTLAMIPVIEEAKVPMLVPVAVATKISQMGSKYMAAKLSLTDDFSDIKLAEWAIKKKGLKKIAFIYENSDYGKPPATAASNKIKELGGEVVAFEAFNPGEVDFKAQLDKIKAAQPDALFMHARGNEGGQIAKQRLQVGLDCTFLANQGQISQAFLNVAGPAAEGMFIPAVWLPENTDEKSKHFVDAYQKTTGGKMPNLSCAQAYDSIYLYADAVKRAGSTDKDKVRDAIRDTKDFVGVCGKYQFDETGQGVYDPFVVICKDGKWTFHDTVQ